MLRGKALPPPPVRAGVAPLSERAKLMKNSVMSPEAAQADFDRFVEANAIDDELEDMDTEDRAAFKKQRKRMLTALGDGSLVINDEGEAVYTPKNSADGAPIHFRERTGASLMASDRHGKGKDVAKTYAIMADMTQETPKRFALLKGVDIKVCEAIYALLMD